MFSDIPNNRILRYDEETDQVTLFRKPSNNSNGHTRDRQGRLISCEHFTRRVTRTEYDGTITVLIDQFEDKPLNAPNDVVVHSDDSIWFTDPGYGILFAYEGQHAEFELPTQVYRIDGISNEATVVAEDMDMPNGICFSPDEKTLYVSDTGEPKNIRAYEVNGKTLSKGRCFVEMTRVWQTASVAIYTATYGLPPLGSVTAMMAFIVSHQTARSSEKFTCPRVYPTSVLGAVTKRIDSILRALNRFTQCIWKRGAPNTHETTIQMKNYLEGCDVHRINRKSRSAETHHGYPSA